MTPEARDWQLRRADYFRAELSRLFVAAHKADMTGQAEDVQAYAAITDKIVAEFAAAPSPPPSGRKVAVDLNRIQRNLDALLNDYLCEMKPNYDDSITGFNEAWDVVSKFLNAALAVQDGPCAEIEAGLKAALEALRPFAAMAVNIDQTCDESDAEEAARALSAGCEPFPSGRPSSDTTVETRLLAWGGQEVGDIEYDEFREFRERELTLADFRRAAALLVKYLEIKL